MIADRKRPRLFRSLLTAAFAVCMSLGALPAAAAPSSPTAASPVMTGLQYAASGPCAGIYRVANTDQCTHGSDPAPPVIRQRGGPAPMQPTAAGVAPAVTCDGDGESGKRVQALYVYVTGRQNRRSTYLSSFRTWAANVDGMFQASAAETGGTRRLRWVTGSDCLLSVPAVALSSAAETSFGASIAELGALGYNRADRKYLVWFDSDPRNSPYCGIATVYSDDRPTENSNDAAAGYARADFACWNWAEPHEVMHTLGAVQGTAPHATLGLHCTDEHDHMCYQDLPTSVMTFPCPDRYEQLFDCGHDDYFNTQPAPGSYLATHWNTADSGWLVGAEAVPDTTAPTVERPSVSFLTGGTLTSTTRVRVAWQAASDESGIAAYELQRKKGSGSWVPVGLGSPTAASVDLDVVVGTTYTFRLRARDGAGNTGPWATTTPATPTLLQETATAISYTADFRRKALSGASGGYVKHASVTGSTATMTFTGTSVAFVTTVSPSRGIATATIDGGTAAVLDLYGSTVQTKRVAWAASAGDGSHTVQVTVAGAQNAASTSPRIDVDAFLIWKVTP